MGGTELSIGDEQINSPFLIIKGCLKNAGPQKITLQTPPRMLIRGNAIKVSQANEKRDAIQQYRYSHTSDRGIG